jgi:hypothetical protein
MPPPPKKKKNYNTNLQKDLTELDWRGGGGVKPITRTYHARNQSGNIWLSVRSHTHGLEMFLEFAAKFRPSIFPVLDKNFSLLDKENTLLFPELLCCNC